MSSPTPPPPTGIKRRHRSHVHLLEAVAVGLATVLLAPNAWGQVARLVAAWDTGAVAWTTLAWWTIVRSTAEQTRRRAAAEDPGRTVVWMLTISISAFSLFTTVYLIRTTHHVVYHPSGLVLPLSLLAIASAWAATHTAYTLRYAHLYYRDRGNPEGGIKFPDPSQPSQLSPPSYLDFAYFAFTIGMCFQVSDASLTSRQLRGAVLLHAVLSFGYNTVILAVAINLIVGSIG